MKMIIISEDDRNPKRLLSNEIGAVEGKKKKHGKIKEQLYKNITRDVQKLHVLQ